MPHALPDNGKIRTAVVTGGHPFQVPPFHALFRSLPDVDFYPQSLDEFTADRALAGAYDVVLFYTMHRFAPGDELPWYQKNLFRTLEELIAVPEAQADQLICTAARVRARGEAIHEAMTGS